MEIKNFSLITLWMVGLLFALTAHSLTYSLPHQKDQIIGHIYLIKSQPRDMLQKIARRYEMGYDEIKNANTKLPRYKSIKIDTNVTIPAMFILPKAAHDGIIVNLPEMRLYYYPPNSRSVITEPIAIGRPGWGTPMFHGQVVEKKKNPAWKVPESIMQYSNEKGIELPEIVPPGPNNPLGEYALRLSKWSILIHGTNQPHLIGRRVSSGCIRMYPEDIEQLFNQVPLYTPVYIINEPFKIGWHHHHLYLEVHPRVEDENGDLTPESIEKEKLHQEIFEAIQNSASIINWQKAEKIYAKKSGIPEAIT